MHSGEKMTIYLDVVFLENLILNILILYAVGIETKSKIKILKILISSSIGSVYTVLAYLINDTFFQSIIMKVLLSVAMTYIAYKANSIKELLRIIVYFYLTSFVFGGGALALIYIANSGKISIYNGLICGKYTLLTIMIGVIVSFIVIIISFKLIKNKISRKDIVCYITIKVNDKKVKTKALIDTGNFLKEPITNIPVIVAEHSVFKNIISDEILENIENILGGDLNEISETIKNQYLSKIKIIPFSSLGKQNGMILGISAQEVAIEQNEEIKRIEKIIIGLYNKKLSKKGEYHALVGLSCCQKSPVPVTTK
ncbi:MAG TPA: sigma-E processing peptidase SpoIIGA [Clostridiales bacterium]|nr:sigma-E processing peptidase SpoIIGA [Clostridiales bacterium]